MTVALKSARASRVIVKDYLPILIRELKLKEWDISCRLVKSTTKTYSRLTHDIPGVYYGLTVFPPNLDSEAFTRKANIYLIWDYNETDKALLNTLVHECLHIVLHDLVVTNTATPKSEIVEEKVVKILTNFYIKDKELDEDLYE